MPVNMKRMIAKELFSLIEEKGIKPWNILAITFTNKAASEMKERITNLIGESSNDMWMGTFHSICVRILRRYIDRIGYNSDFVIFDSSDQKTLVKQCIKALNLDDKIFTDRSVLSEISNSKNEMLTPVQYELRTNGELRKEKIAKVYELYQRKLKENNALDLADIQYKILCESAKYLKKGGKLVYSTCTLNPQENNKNTAKFLAEHNDFEGVELELPPELKKAFDEKPYEITLMPHTFDGDGFYIAVLTRR